MTTHSIGYSELHHRKEWRKFKMRAITIGLLLAADIIFVSMFRLGGK